MATATGPPAEGFDREDEQEENDDYDCDQEDNEHNADNCYDDNGTD